MQWSLHTTEQPSNQYSQSAEVVGRQVLSACSDLAGGIVLYPDRMCPELLEVPGRPRISCPHVFSRALPLKGNEGDMATWLWLRKGASM